MHTDGFMICPKCSIEIPIYIKREENFEFNSNTNIIIKPPSDICNFVKRIETFSGILPETYPSNLEAIIDLYFTSCGYKTCKEIRNLPINPDVRTRGNTNKKILEYILKKASIQKLYDHSEWICFEYWGWVRHDITIITDHKVTRLNSLYSKISSIMSHTMCATKIRINLVIKILELYNIHHIVMMSTSSDEYEKPKIGMWNRVFTNGKNTYGSYEMMYYSNINRISLFYCGNDAGSVSDF